MGFQLPLTKQRGGASLISSGKEFHMWVPPWQLSSLGCGERPFHSEVPEQNLGEGLLMLSKCQAPQMLGKGVQPSFEKGSMMPMIVMMI